jgi:hypothetical protein
MLMAMVILEEQSALTNAMVILVTGWIIPTNAQII